MVAKTRLTSSHRLVLINFAKNNINLAKPRALVETTYEKAAAAVISQMEKTFPAADMAILKKYKCADPDYCISGGTPNGSYLVFTFRGQYGAEEERKKFLVPPMAPNRGCSTRSLQWSQKTTDAILAWTKAKDAAEKSEEEIYLKYKTLINSARTFEEVVEVWPAAIGLKEKICAPGTSLVAISDDIREFIRSDNAGAEAVSP